MNIALFRPGFIRDSVASKLTCNSNRLSESNTKAILLWERVASWIWSRLGTTFRSWSKCKSGYQSSSNCRVL